MDLRIDNPEFERALSDLAQKSGRAADDLIEDALAGYFEELEELRGALDARYDELKAGGVRLIGAETAVNTLRAKSEERRSGA
jgi:predicted DNA-binding protein